ncbi:cell division protein FtsQ/DivIB [Fonticella tunisiensis]|uniref:Cell division protein FtsQ n=1 Tax=Fonticella tunisiensis TaxID=1096341 RepID=A0A4R7KRF1_9CLOT|nr:FtsQ-type POTRA domain-containing protein [Fonticella tunisiensis]TDT61857.1 cell division protein FtsQ [Fonticella tunisiensis]
MPEKKLEKRLKRRKRFIGFSALIICAGIMVSLALKSSYFIINNIVVEKNNYISKEEVLALLNIKNENIFLINKKELEKNVLQNPYVDSVAIRRRLPSTLIVEIKEKEIKGLVQYNNSFINVDKDGKMVHIVNKFPDGNLPLIEGVKVEQYAVNEPVVKGDEVKERALKAVLTIQDYKECRGLFYSINIEDPYRIVLTTKDKMQTIDIGDSTNLEYKLGFAIAILSNDKVKGKKVFIEISSDGTAVFRELGKG